MQIGQATTTPAKAALDTVFLLVVIMLGYGGIVYGSVGYRFLFLAESRHYSAGFIFAPAAWAAGPTAWATAAPGAASSSAEWSSPQPRHGAGSC